MNAKKRLSCLTTVLATDQNWIKLTKSGRVLSVAWSLASFFVCLFVRSFFNYFFLCQQQKSIYRCPRANLSKMYEKKLEPKKKVKTFRALSSKIVKKVVLNLLAILNLGHNFEIALCLKNQGNYMLDWVYSYFLFKTILIYYSVQF